MNLIKPPKIDSDDKVVTVTFLWGGADKTKIEILSQIRIIHFALQGIMKKHITRFAHIILFHHQNNKSRCATHINILIAASSSTLY